MPDPYTTLGIPRGADRATIRRAYRKRAKAAHPDAGGSSERFGALTRAHDLLTDDERRERFDRTGDDSEAQPDNSHAMPLQLISAALDEVLGDIEKEGREPHQVADLHKLILRKIHARKAVIDKDVQAMHVAVAKNEILLGRFTVTAGENRLDALIRGRVALVRGMIESATRMKAQLDDAAKIVEGHGFRSDREPARPPPSFSQVIFRFAQG